MTLGERIQKHRKNLGLSQDELGQKLLVSRQTVSQWEKDQTVPTIDKLMRLSDIFHTSLDEILGTETALQEADPQANEAYRFTFAKEELDEIYRLRKKIIYKNPVLFALVCVLLIVYLISTSASGIIIGFAFGALLTGSASHIKGIHAYNKVWKSSVERIIKSTYEYRLFEEYIEINIYRKNEMIRKSKCCYTDIEQMQQLGKWLFMQFGGQSFIIRKSELKENSAFYSYMYRNPSKTTETKSPDKWRAVSALLFIASLLSILGAVALVSAVSKANGLFAENMWLFFLLTPVPIASIVWGLVLRTKGYKYRKNIIVGIVMTALLCIYGSFTFMFR